MVDSLLNKVLSCKSTDPSLNSSLHRFTPQEYKTPSRLEKLINNENPPARTGVIKKVLKEPTRNLSTLKLAHKKPSKVSKPQPEKQIDAEFYRKQLEYSRNYSKYMQDLKAGETREDLFPAIPKKRPREEPEEQKKPSVPIEPPKNQIISRLGHLIEKKRKDEISPKFKMSKGLLNGPMIWCARCKKEHHKDFHKKQQELKEKKRKVITTSGKSEVAKPVFKVPSSKKVARDYRRGEENEYSYSEEESDYMEESDLSDFIEDDTELSSRNISQVVRKMFNYDPTKYRDIDDMDDRNMESSIDRIIMEDRYSSKIAQKEDMEEWKKLQRERLKRKNK